MAFRNPSNQLIQIDTGNALTYLWNQNQSAIKVYATIGETQVLGQRYFSISDASAENPYGSPAIYILAQYLSTSATTTGNIQAAPAPVYWTDNTFTVVSGIPSETLGINFPAGYMMVNTTSLPNLTGALLAGAYLLVQVAGLVVSAYSPQTGTAGVGNWIEGYGTGNFGSQSVVAGTAPGYKPFGIQQTAIASGLCSVLVDCDII